MGYAIRRAAIGAGSIGFVAIAASCREPTEVTLVLSSSVKCGELSTVEIIVSPDATTTDGRFKEHFTSAEARSCQPPEQPGTVGTLVVTPSTGAGTILVAAGVRVGDQPAPDPHDCADPEVAKRCIIARRNIAFVDHRSLSLPITLDPICLGQMCDPASTCFRGSCVDARVMCNGTDCGLPQENPGMGDGGATEAGSGDGSYDPPFDGGPFEDASRDGGDASIDGSDGGGFPDCYNSGASGSFAACYAGHLGPGPYGTVTSGSCTSGGSATDFCCTCYCPYTMTLASCDLSSGGSSASSGQSCFPTTCHR